MPEYRITEKAGPYVAGRANLGVGHTIFLTPREAAHDVRLGTLEEVRPKAAPQAKKKGGQAAE